MPVGAGVALNVTHSILPLSAGCYIFSHVRTESINTMLRKAISVVTLTSAPAINVAAADTLIVDGIDAGAASGTPSRGLSQASVAATWGEPQSRSGPVGDPPISNWDYGTFVVYFEYSRVIHAVQKN